VAVVEGVRRLSIVTGLVAVGWWIFYLLMAPGMGAAYGNFKFWIFVVGMSAVFFGLGWGATRLVAWVVRGFRQ